MQAKDTALRLSSLKKEQKELQRQLDEVKKNVKAAEKELIDCFHQEGVDRIDLKGVGSFSISEVKRYSMADREEFFDFLHARGDESIISVNSRTLNSYVRELVESKEREGDDAFEVPGTKSFSDFKVYMRKS